MSRELGGETQPCPKCTSVWKASYEREKSKRVDLDQKLSDARAALRALRDKLEDAEFCQECAVASPAIEIIDRALTTPAPVAVPADDVSRCAVCAWPLSASVKEGCVRGNCALRPRPDRLYAPERAASEAACAGCAGCAKVARHPGEGYVCAMHPGERA